MTDANRSFVSQTPQAGGCCRFGTFEVNFAERELRNRGIRVNLQKKPFQILELLLRRPGALVTREELARYLWPDLHVSFSHGLNTAVNTLRQALGDSPGAPRYIETRSGLGYRFIASVEEIADTRAAATEEKLSARKRYRSKQEPYQDYLKGKYLQNKLTKASLGKSIAHFEAAVAQDRRYAPAYTGLAETFIQFGLLGLLASRDAQARAAEMNVRALDIDPDLAEGYALRARIRQLFERDYAGAETEYKRALELDPEYVESYIWLAGLLAARGRAAEAIEKVRRAQELEALSLAIHAETAWIYYVARQYEACANQSWQALILEAHFAPAQHTLGLAYEQTGLQEEAITELSNALLCSEDNVAIVAGLGHACARIGKHSEAEMMLKKLDDLAQEQTVSPYWRSVLYSGLGEDEAALKSLERAQQQGDPWLMWLNAEPRFDRLRGSAAFERLVERAGFRGPEMTGSAYAACGNKA